VLVAVVVARSLLVLSVVLAVLVALFKQIFP
jgi:hypothetical protein